MNINLTVDDRRLLMQGIWKEMTHYQGILDRGECNFIGTDHVIKMLERLNNLESILLKGN